MIPLVEPQDTALPLKEFLHHIHNQRWCSLGVFAVVLMLALLAAAVLQPSYRATAILAVLPSPEFTVRAAAGSHDANASALALDQIMKTETEILDSDDLHGATLRTLGPKILYPDIFAPPSRGWLRQAVHALAPVLLAPWRVPPLDEVAAKTERGLRRFRTDLSVLPAKDANIITVTFDNGDPQRAADAVNTMLSLYAERRSRLYDDPQLELVKREAEAGARAVTTAERILADFKRDNAISDYEQERGLLLQRRSQIQQQVADATASASEYEARMSSLGRLLNAEPATINIFEEKDPDTRLLAVNAGLQDARAKLAAAGDKYKDSSRVIVTLRAQITSHEAESARLSQNGAASVVRRGRNPSLDPLRLDRARAAAELSAALARLSSNRDQLRDVSASVIKLDADEAGLAALIRQKASAEQIYRDTGRIFAERRLSEAEDARRLANVRVIQPAAVPQTPRALPLLVIAAGLALGTLAACAWTVAIFMFRPVFFTGEGLAAAAGVPVLAVFTKPPERVPDRLLTARRCCPGLPAISCLSIIRAGRTHPRLALATEETTCGLRC